MAGVPFTPPLISTCQTAFRRLAPAAPSVAPAGWPSRARSPRYMAQSPPVSVDGEGEAPFPVEHAPSKAVARHTPAARLSVAAGVLLAAVNRARDRVRFVRTQPAMEQRQW